MKRLTPDYYEEFACIKGDCRHNCCIGWEIDIDRDTVSLYDTLPDIHEHIDNEPTPHFRLDNNGRCPFLNEDNLCRLILQYGAEALCDVCAMHPRFCNEHGRYLELGLGLCCEAAARLILTRTAPVALSAKDPFRLRRRVTAILQDRSRSLSYRVAAMLRLCRATPPVLTVSALKGLERLDERWTAYLDRLERPVDTAAFDRHMAMRQTEYEQLLVYLVYRHFPVLDGQKTAALAAAVYHLIYGLGAAMYTQTGAFTVDDQIELVRLFSAETEYSDENLAAFIGYAP